MTPKVSWSMANCSGCSVVEVEELASGAETPGKTTRPASYYYYAFQIKGWHPPVPVE